MITINSKMAWVMNNLVHNTFSCLYTQNGDSFTVNDDCLAILEGILRKLSTEGCTHCAFRRSIGFGQTIRKNLIPLLLYVKDGTKITDATKIIDTTIKILVNLTIPLEYLLSTEVISRTDAGKQTIYELNRLLTTSKEAFTDSRNTKAIIDHMKYVVENDPLSLEQCDTINNCLLLIRNILHIPENKTLTSNSPLIHSTMQNQIIWNLFTQGIDKIVIYLMSSRQRMYWVITMVQVIALLYKDQHVNNLQKLLNLWLESSYSESSEDNESNTSPPDQGSDDSSPVITSDPTSDSSDTGGNDQNRHSNTKINTSERSKNNTAEIVHGAQNRSRTFISTRRNKSTETETSTSSGISSMGHSIESNESQSQNLQSQTNEQDSLSKNVCSTYPSSQSEMSDCGYVTQIENQESISTSSNDDEQPQQRPVHQKPHSFQKSRYNSGKCRPATASEKKDLRRKKLVKRSKTNIINMKGLMHHLPTEDDVANILKEFTVDFLLKSYGTLVKDLHSQLLTNIHMHIDTSHFFWLVTYFLKFGTQLELEPEHISPVLSYEILSYLIFQGIWIHEELEISCTIQDNDLKPCLRRLHLVVTAIREFLQAVELYQRMNHLSDSDRANLSKLQAQIRETEELKMLFIILLRKYNPKIQSKQYLQDLIVTNHNFLLFLDNASKTQNQHFNMMDHLKQFATVEIMRRYGMLLEDFKENGEFVNNCIFTMMHHTGGDLKNIPTLFQPSILKTFSQIWETDYEICDDWSDLIEYVIHTFINAPSTHSIEPTNCTSVDEFEQQSLSESKSSEWTKEEKDNLLKYYNQSRESTDTIASITKKYANSSMKHKTQHSVIQELMEQNIISVNEYNELMKSNKQIEKEVQIPLNENFKQSFEKIFRADEFVTDSDIKILREYLCKDDKGQFIIWLQNLLIEACYVKLVLSHIEELNDNIMEPTIYYFALLNLPIPVIPWTTEQSNILKHQPFILLLHKIGFYLPVDTGKIFVRMPNFWTAEYMFSIAEQLGSIDPGKLKFDIHKLTGKQCSQLTIKCQNYIPPSEFEMFSIADLKETPSVICNTPIVAPDREAIICNIPPPKLATFKEAIANRKYSPLSMDCSPSHDSLDLNDVAEINSNCDTASVASDLTRMCVSDEEEKVILVIEKTLKKY